MWVIDSDHRLAVQVDSFWIVSPKELTNDDSYYIEVYGSRASAKNLEMPDVLLAEGILPERRYHSFFNQWIDKVNDYLRVNKIVDFQKILESFNN